MMEDEEDDDDDDEAETATDDGGERNETFHPRTTIGEEDLMLLDVYVSMSISRFRLCSEEHRRPLDVRRAEKGNI